MASTFKEHRNVGSKYPLLYHYCSVETLHKIISSQTLRLTNIQQMNDSQEFHYSMELLKELYPNHDVVNLYRSPSDHIYTEIFASCFSEKPDLLGQWKSYGDNTKGVCIGFDFNIINPNAFLLRGDNSDVGYVFDVIKVKYDKENQQNIIHTFINDYKQDSENRGVIFNKSVSSIKHEGFYEEQEWRLVSSLEHGIRDSPSNNKAQKFMPHNGNIKQYIDINFSELFEMSQFNDCWSNMDEQLRENWDCRLSPIKEIWLGTNCPLMEPVVDKFLLHFMPSKRIEIKKSTIPFRI